MEGWAGGRGAGGPGGAENVTWLSTSNHHDKYRHPETPYIWRGKEKSEDFILTDTASWDPAYL